MQYLAPPDTHVSDRVRIRGLCPLSISGLLTVRLGVSPPPVPANAGESAVVGRSEL